MNLDSFIWLLTEQATILPKTKHTSKLKQTGTGVRNNEGRPGQVCPEGYLRLEQKIAMVIA